MTKYIGHLKRLAGTSQVEERGMIKYNAKYTITGAKRPTAEYASSSKITAL